MGFYIKKISSVSENDKFQNLIDMGIHWTSLKTGVQNNLQNWKILKIGQVTVKNRFLNFLVSTQKSVFLA